MYSRSLLFKAWFIAQLSNAADWLSEDLRDTASVSPLFRLLRGRLALSLSLTLCLGLLSLVLELLAPNVFEALVDRGVRLDELLMAGLEAANIPDLIIDVLNLFVEFVSLVFLIWHYWRPQLEDLAFFVAFLLSLVASFGLLVVKLQAHLLNQDLLLAEVQLVDDVL